MPRGGENATVKANENAKAAAAAASATARMGNIREAQPISLLRVGIRYLLLVVEPHQGSKLLARAWPQTFASSQVSGFACCCRLL